MASIDPLKRSFHSSYDDMFLKGPCSQFAAHSSTPHTTSSNSTHMYFSEVVDWDHVPDNPSTAYNMSSLLQEDYSMLLLDLDTMPASTAALKDATDITICDIWSLVGEPDLHLDATYKADATHGTHKPDATHQEDLLLPPPLPSPAMDTIQASLSRFATGNNIHSTPTTRPTHYNYCKYFAKRPCQILRKPFTSSFPTSLMAGLKDKNAENCDDIVLRTSKNLISERRRRKKFNDKLYSLRALVPKISRMDKASIVSDAVEHVQDLQKQVALRQQEVSTLQSRLDAGGCDVLITPRRRRGPSSIYPQHKVLKMDFVEMEEGRYQLRIACAKGKGVLVQLSRVMEALHFDILCANLISIGNRSLGMLVLQAKSIKSKELKETIVETLPKFGLSFM